MSLQEINENRVGEGPFCPAQYRLLCRRTAVRTARLSISNSSIVYPHSFHLSIIYLSIYLSIIYHLSIYLGSTGIWTQGFTLDRQELYYLSQANPCFVIFFFWDRVFRTICLGWFWNTVLLISASQVARITVINHRCLTYFYFLVVLGVELRASYLLYHFSYASSPFIFFSWWYRCLNSGPHAC
jgi:hypothetical protein